jgi:O-antigen ligase
VLFVRRQQLWTVVKQNWAILFYFLYCLASTFWSDFPFVAFKRWTKALGNVLMVLIVLTDANPSAAVKRFFSRMAFVLIPVSILLIKYYPDLGRGYYRWSWTPFYTGVTTDKNSLGAICFVFGLAAVWRVTEALWEKPQPKAGKSRAHGVLGALGIWLLRTLRIQKSLIAHAVLLGLAVFLLLITDSSTSLACLILGSFLIVATQGNVGRRPTRVYVLTGVMGFGAALVYMFPDVFAMLTHSLGRGTDLTGRVDIWNDIFHMHLDPWLGTGFESFWLGKRIEFLWEKYYFHPNQAHNGYIETYINLGILGLGALALQIVAGYRNVTAGFRRRAPASSLKLAYLLTALVYNVTEAAFKVMTPVWIVYLFAIMAVPVAPKRKPEESGGAETGGHLDPALAAHTLSDHPEPGKLVYSSTSQALVSADSAPFGGKPAIAAGCS